MDSRKSLRPWLIALCGIGLATTSSACFGSSSSKAKDEQLGQLSVADRNQLLQYERNVDVAKANIDASKVALDEAKQFRESSESEQNAAEELHKAAGKELKAAAKSGNVDTPALQSGEQMRANQVAATRAKHEYADQLVKLREAEVDDREAEHELTEAQLDSAQYDLLAQRNLQGKLDGNKFNERLRKAQAEKQKTNIAVQENLAAARSSRENWSSLRRTATTGQAPIQQQAQPQGEEPELIEAPQSPDTLQSPQR